MPRSVWESLARVSRLGGGWGSDHSALRDLQRFVMNKRLVKFILRFFRRHGSGSTLLG
jgi:hypothetical protein